MGSGGGIEAFAVRMGRVAIPLVRKYVLPVARQIGRNLLETAIPEIGDILAEAQSKTFIKCREKYCCKNNE